MEGALLKQREELVCLFVCQFVLFSIALIITGLSLYSESLCCSRFCTFLFPSQKIYRYKSGRSLVSILCMSHPKEKDGIICSVQLHLIKWLLSFHLVVKHSHLSLICLNFCRSSQAGIYYCPLTLIYFWNYLHGFCQCYLHIFIMNSAYLGAGLIYECLACYAPLFSFHFWFVQRVWEKW